MSRIHPTSVVSPSAELGSDIEIGPFCVIGDAVTIGDNCRIETRAEIKSGVILGNDNVIGTGAIIGGAPQHTNCPPSIGGVSIGNRNTFRENVTIHRALNECSVTFIGDDNLLMVNAHVGHDCILGTRTIIANNVMLAGHVIVQDRAYISGAVGVHQFCRIGKLAMVGGQAHITKDVPPFVTIDGVSSQIVGLNSVGIRRAELGRTAMQDLKLAYRIAYRSNLTWSDSISQLKATFRAGLGREFAEFLEMTKRGCVGERHAKRMTTLKLHDSGSDFSGTASTRAA